MKNESDWQWKQEKKKNIGMQLWIMKAEWAMMKDDWQMMKDEWEMMNEGEIMNNEWQTFSLLLILSISLSHSLTNLLCHTFSQAHGVERSW